MVNVCHTLTTCTYAKPQPTNMSGVQSMANSCVCCKLTSSTIQQIQCWAVEKLCFRGRLIFHIKFLIDTAVSFYTYMHSILNICWPINSTNGMKQMSLECCILSCSPKRFSKPIRSSGILKCSLVLGCYCRLTSMTRSYATSSNIRD